MTLIHFHHFNETKSLIYEDFYCSKGDILIRKCPITFMRNKGSIRFSKLNCLLLLPDLSEKAMAPHSSTLAWKIPWTEEPRRLQSMMSLRVRHNWMTSLSLFTFHFHALEKEVVTHSSVLAWGIPGTGEPGGLPSMGSHRVGHDGSNLAALPDL